VVFSILHSRRAIRRSVIAATECDTEQIEAIRPNLRLDFGLHEQFILWVGNALRGEFAYRSPIVRSRSCRAAPRTDDRAAVMTTIVAIVFAVPMGRAGSLKAGSAIDRGVMSVAVLGFSSRSSSSLCADLHFRYEASDSSDPRAIDPWPRALAIPAPF